VGRPSDGWTAPPGTTATGALVRYRDILHPWAVLYKAFPADEPGGADCVAMRYAPDSPEKWADDNCDGGSKKFDCLCKLVPG
jgi:hypothetical protein